MPTVNLGRVTLVDEGLHDETLAYKNLSLVQDAGGNWYKSKQAVPADTLLADTAYWGLFLDNSGNGFDYVVASDPGVSVNPPNDYATWINYTTGRVFSCSDRTPGMNVWESDDSADELAALKNDLTPMVGSTRMDTSPDLLPGWILWHETTVVGALVADYPLLAASNSEVVLNLDNGAGTFDFKGHESRYWRPAGTAVAGGQTLEDEIKSHTHGVRIYEAGPHTSQEFVSQNWDDRYYSDKNVGATGGDESRPKTMGMYAKIYIGVQA